MQLAAAPRPGERAAVGTHLDAHAVAHAAVRADVPHAAVGVALVRRAAQLAVLPHAVHRRAVGLGEDAGAPRRVAPPTNAQRAQRPARRRRLAVARTLVDNEATDAVAASVSHSAFETRAFPERERAAAVRKALRVDGAAPHRGDVVRDDHTRLGVKSTRPSCEVAFAPNTMLVTATPVLLAVAVVLATIILRASVRPGGAPPLLILASR